MADSSSSPVPGCSRSPTYWCGTRHAGDSSPYRANGAVVCGIIATGHGKGSTGSKPQPELVSGGGTADSEAAAAPEQTASCGSSSQTRTPTTCISCSSTRGSRWRSWRCCPSCSAGSSPGGCCARCERSRRLRGPSRQPTCTGGLALGGPERRAEGARRHLRRSARPPGNLRPSPTSIRRQRLA